MAGGDGATRRRRLAAVLRMYSSRHHATPRGTRAQFPQWRACMSVTGTARLERAPGPMGPRRGRAVSPLCPPTSTEAAADCSMEMTLGASSALFLRVMMVALAALQKHVCCPLCAASAAAPSIWFHPAASGAPPSRTKSSEPQHRAAGSAAWEARSLGYLFAKETCNRPACAGRVPAAAAPPAACSASHPAAAVRALAGSARPWLAGWRPTR